jgi:hypothetical protein
LISACTLGAGMGLSVRQYPPFGPRSLRTNPWEIKRCISELLVLVDKPVSPRMLEMVPILAPGSLLARISHKIRCASVTLLIGFPQSIVK